MLEINITFYFNLTQSFCFNLSCLHEFVRIKNYVFIIFQLIFDKNTFFLLEFLKSNTSFI